MESSVTDFLRDHVHPREGKTLIVGSSIKPGRQDRRKLYEDALGLDMEPGDGVDLVHDLEEPLPMRMLGTFSHAECTSVLEHSRRPWLLAKNLEEALVPGGTLYLSAPFVWRQHGYPNDYFRYTDEGIRALFPRIEWEILTYIGAITTTNANKALLPQRRGSHPYFARTEVYGFGVRK